MFDLKDAVRPEPKARKPAVLVVEDEALVRIALADYLEDCEFAVYHAPDAAGAVALLEAAEIPIDAVLTDVRMPGVMDGFGLARWIRQNRPGVPVLITTGDNIRAGTDLCSGNPIIPKPHDFKLVAARLRAAIAGNDNRL